MICIWNIRFLKKLAFKPNCIDFFFSDVHVFEVDRIIVNCRLGRSGGWQLKRAGGRMGVQPCLPDHAEATPLCQRDMPACFLCVKKNVTLWWWFSHISVGFSCQFLNLISLEMFFKLASIIMTQNFVLNYHDCFWGPGIINIYYILIVWDYFDTFLWYVTYFSFD